MNKTYTISHKAAMDDAFRPAKGSPACHVCRYARSPAKPGQPFTCCLSLNMDARSCVSFVDARRPAFDYSKVVA